MRSRLRYCLAVGGFMMRTTKPREQPSLVLAIDTDAYALPCDASASSLAIVPSQPPTMRDVVEEQRLLESLRVAEGSAAEDGMGCRAVHALSLANWDAGVSHALSATGAIDSTFDEFGELILSTRSSGVAWSVATTVTEPMLAMRAHMNVAIMHTPKVEWLVRLLMEGWVGEEERQTPWSPGGALVYRTGMHQPISYWACLASRDKVVAKGIVEIKHKMTDNYYKCLLFMDGPRLRATLDQMADKSDDWFRQQLKDSGCRRADAALEDDPDDAPPLPALQGPDGPQYEADMPIVPFVVQSDEWSRCIVSHPSCPPTRVYFDHTSHQSGRQRGWVECRAHGCIKYEFCRGTKESFCARMMLWMADADRHDNKPAHLAFKPSEDVVTALASDIALAPF